MATFSHDDLERIRGQLKEGSLNDRRLALNELANCDSEVAVTFLRSFLESPDFSLRKFVAMGLGNHLTDSSFSLLELMSKEEKDPNVLSEVGNSLYEFGDRALPILQDMFEAHDNWLLRQTILSLVAESKDEQRIWDVALLALEDKHQTVKETGIFALGLLLRGDFNAKAWAELQRLAEHPFWRTRWRVAIALQHGSLEQVQPLLLKMKGDEHFRVVSAAMDVLNAFSS